MRTKRINVMFILWGFSVPFPGAAWRRIDFFSRYLLRKGFNVFIVGSRSIGKSFLLHRIKTVKSIVKNAKAKENLSSYDLPILNIPFRISIGARPLNILLALIPLLTLFLILRPHVVLVSIPSNESVLATYIFGKILRFKVIVDIRDPVEELYYTYYAKGSVKKMIAKIIKKINYAIYKHVDAVIVVTSKLKSMLSSEGIKTILIPNGADLNTFKPYLDHRRHVRKILGINEEDVVIVVSGSETSYYPVHKFLPYLALIKKECNNANFKLKLLLVGKFANTFKCSKILGIQNSIIYAGSYQNPIKVAEILSAADLGLIYRVSDPVFDYSVPAKFYEYIACGLPVFVIARRESELARITKSWKVGIMCDYNVKCIVSFLKDLTIYGTKILESYRKRVLKSRFKVNRARAACKLALLLKKLLEA